jgi:two-component system, NarL family, response regulator
MLTSQGVVDRRLRGGRHSARIASKPANSLGAIADLDILRGNQPAHTTRLDLNVPDLQFVPVQDPETEPGMPKCITVLVVDDHPIVLEGLVALIQRRSDMRVIAEARNGHEAVDKFYAYRPDVSLVDLRMPTMDGIEVVRAVCDRDPAARLVILSSYQSEEDIYRAMRAGARGYLLKDAPVDELVECIHQVNAGRTWVPSSVGAKLAKRISDQELTKREMEVLHALSSGKSNKEIGTALGISEATVKVHVTHILEKLKVTGRTEAINIAAKRGLVQMDVTAAA